jgi:hypothetical protein
MILEHKGYIAKVTYHEGDNDMHGQVLNTAKDVLHFAGRSIDDKPIQTPDIFALLCT